MEDSKAASEGGEQNRFHETTKALSGLACKAIKDASLRSARVDVSVLDDDEFLDRLASKLAPRLRGLQLEQSSNRVGALGAAVKSFEQVAASAAKQDQSLG